jgi:hypothetical protein
MEADWFLASFGGLKTKLDEKSREVLLENAKMYIRAGGQLTWNMWSTMSTETKAIFVDANDEVNLERMSTLVATFISAMNMGKTQDEIEKEAISRA